MKAETSYDNEPVFFIGGRTWLTRGRMTADGFVVLAGSTVNRICDSFKRARLYALRTRLEEEGVISDGIVTRDYIFPNARQAGCVIACRPIATNTAWRTEDEDERTWGECHPSLRGERRYRHSVVKAHAEASRPPEGASRDEYGVSIHFHTNADGSTVERRGRCW